MKVNRITIKPEWFRSDQYLKLTEKCGPIGVHVTLKVWSIGAEQFENGIIEGNLNTLAGMCDDLSWTGPDAMTRKDWQNVVLDLCSDDIGVLKDLGNGSFEILNWSTILPIKDRVGVKRERARRGAATRWGPGGGKAKL